MKTYSGKEIYDQMSRLHREINELGQACDTVSDEIGQMSLAYKILNENYKEKKRDLQKAELQRYEVPEKEVYSVLLG